MNTKFKALAALAVAGALVRMGAPARAQFTVIPQPNAAYLGATQLFPVTDPDFNTLSSLTVGVVTATFSSDLVALTVPTTWSNWGAPPNAESSTPRVLWTNGLTSVEIDLSSPAAILGFEAQPNTSVPGDITAEFFSGATSLGSITQSVDGNGGARLFAAQSTGIDQVVITANDDFAIAQLREAATVPEPCALAFVGAGIFFAGFAGYRRRTIA